MSKTTTVAKNIKKYRKEKGLSQDKLARLADIAHATIINFELRNTCFSKNPMHAKTPSVQGTDDL